MDTGISREADTAFRPKKRPTATTKTINLALQGGGAHGAFTWGVLDRLLEEERIAIEGITATSAGAMNAAVLAYGFTIGGRDGAKTALTNFWRRISHAAILSTAAAELARPVAQIIRCASRRPSSCSIS